MSDHVINYDTPMTGGRGFLVMKQISWAAVFAGALVALAVEVLFLSFGLFIGFRMGPGGARVWAPIWFFAGCFFSLMAGGWVAGRLGGNPQHGKVHAIVTWGLATVTTFVFLMTLSWGVVNQSLGLMRTAALAAASAPPTVSRLAPNEANRMLEEPGAALNRAQQQLPYVAQMVGHDISNAALRLWIGFMVGACGALAGGAIGAPKVAPPPLA
jgi:hypothetical protein